MVEKLPGQKSQMALNGAWAFLRQGAGPRLSEKGLKEENVEMIQLMREK